MSMDIFLSTLINPSTSSTALISQMVQKKLTKNYLPSVAIEAAFGYWGKQCKSSMVAKENCAVKCLSPACYELIYESDPLEEGEKDYVRSQEYKYCMHTVSTAFIEPLPVIDFVTKLLNTDVFARPLSDADRVKIKKGPRGVKVEVTHYGNMRRKYRISGLTSQATRELNSLGKCINALAENSPEIPTRDCKLTRLLRNSFGDLCSSNPKPVRSTDSR
ncbi:hypothetical protein L2E82_29823 [Cichorium intybus]|uniref:Uncharacterized protein n=1 Tax=Cichorium intybus TaxID=13427 RepID=A0ACB9CYM4_CICIN|nr:hypothetical protein L2E82_29823 [Cichorium intybus]